MGLNEERLYLNYRLRNSLLFRKYLIPSLADNRKSLLKGRCILCLSRMRLLFLFPRSSHAKGTFSPKSRNLRVPTHSGRYQAIWRPIASITESSNFHCDDTTCALACSWDGLVPKTGHCAIGFRIRSRPGLSQYLNPVRIYPSYGKLLLSS